MSVIFGIDEKDKLVICGDKRGSSESGSILSDELQKVSVINTHLAFASAGNFAIEKALLLDIKKQDEVTLFAEGLLNIIIDFYDKAKSLNLGVILDMPFCALIAGQGCDSTSKLISVSFIRRKLSYNEVAMALYPPCDAKMDDCCQIFATNYNMHHDDFCEHTVKGIAAISQAVSPSGHVWTFDKKDCKGRMTEF